MLFLNHGKIAVRGPIYRSKRVRRTERVVHAPLEGFLHQQTHSIVRHGKIAVQVPIFPPKIVRRTETAAYARMKRSPT